MIAFYLLHNNENKLSTLARFVGAFFEAYPVSPFPPLLSCFFPVHLLSIYLPCDIYSIYSIYSTPSAGYLLIFC